jgi:hypothetical protein
MGPWESQESSYLPTTRLHKVNEAAHVRSATPLNPVLSQMRSYWAVRATSSPKGHVGSAVEKAFDDRLDVGGMRGDSLSGVPEARTAHIAFTRA